jgi:hypothetical protein
MKFDSEFSRMKQIHTEIPTGLKMPRPVQSDPTRAARVDGNAPSSSSASKTLEQLVRFDVAECDRTFVELTPHPPPTLICACAVLMHFLSADSSIPRLVVFAQMLPDAGCRLHGSRFAFRVDARQTVTLHYRACGLFC